MNAAFPRTLLPIPLPPLIPKCTPHPCPPKEEAPQVHQTNTTQDIINLGTNPHIKATQ